MLSLLGHRLALPGDLLVLACLLLDAPLGLFHQPGIVRFPATAGEHRQQSHSEKDRWDGSFHAEFSIV